MDARTLTIALGGKWKAKGGNAPCPVCQPERRRDQDALSITEDGGKLLLHCFKGGCAFRDIAAAAGIAPGNVSSPDPATLAAREAEKRAEAEKRERQAQAIWAEALPIGGTLAETYLRGRGITRTLPATLRFHPDCWHGPSARRYPALVALVEGSGGFGIHRTYLRADGAGKADIDPPKAMLGTCAGGAVKLSDGPGPLVACEGIETGLSLLSGLLGEPASVWAALSTSGLRALNLPRQPGNLVIASDGDAPGHEAAEALAHRAHSAGWGVTRLAAPEGQDWNDMLDETGAGAVAPLVMPPDWKPGLIKGPRGRPIWCAENACAVLEADPAWAGVLAHDEFAGLTLLMKPIPGTTAPRANFMPRPLADTDITAAVRWFNRNGFPDATKNMTADAMLAVAAQAVISPVRHYLEGLTWDRTPRVDGWLSHYCGAAESTFTRKAGAAWLISAVARALSPGCKADCALVLEGRQGAGKSSAIKALAGEAWFHDGLHDLHSKDASAGLRGKWIIELPELSAMRRSDVEAVKAFLSRTEERYRPAYARAEVVEPRRCVFAGTTNRTDYLSDDTGGRRFWPVTVGKVDVPGLSRDRDQIWAEAVARFRAGESWWLDRDAEAEAAKVVATRAAEDPWEADVLRAVMGLHEVSTPDIFQRLDVPLDRRSKADAMRITGILTRAGWTNGGRFTGGPSKGLTRYLPPKGGSG